MGKVKRELYEPMQEALQDEPFTEEGMDTSIKWVRMYMQTDEYKKEHDEAFNSSSTT
jgi:hypothetical protein